MKVAASPRVYMRQCPKVVFKSLVTSHSRFLTPKETLSIRVLDRLTNVFKPLRGFILPPHRPHLYCGEAATTTLNLEP